MLRVLLVAAFVTAVLAGRSPNADYVSELADKQPMTRYSNNVIEDAMLDVPALVTKYGYPIEVHTITTPDGYVLTAHRIPHGRDQNNKRDPNRKVAVVVHGLMASSADFLVLGPGNALGYMLAEAGYDVWLPNARGNFYSRRHIRLNPNSKINLNFWKFSWDEIGHIDLPAVLTHIERITGQTKYHYVGHSQGATSFLVLNSLKPEFNEKFYSFQALAPGAFFRYNDNPGTIGMAPFIGIIEPTAYALGIGEVFGNRDFITWFTLRYCTEGSIFSAICTSVIVSGTSEYLNQTMIPVFLGHAPAGASVRQFTHYGQSINRDTFRRYDHGFLTNLRVYGSRSPPDYPLYKITTPTYIHYAKNDVTANYKDVELLAKKLPNVKKTFLVNSAAFDHLDFVWGSTAKHHVYNKVIDVMKETENDVM